MRANKRAIKKCWQNVSSWSAWSC